MAAEFRTTAVHPLPHVRPANGILTPGMPGSVTTLRGDSRGKVQRLITQPIRLCIEPRWPDRTRRTREAGWRREAASGPTSPTQRNGPPLVTVSRLGRRNTRRRRPSSCRSSRETRAHAPTTRAAPKPYESVTDQPQLVQPGSNRLMPQPRHPPSPQHNAKPTPASGIRRPVGR